MATTIDETGFHRDRYQDVRDENAKRWNDSFPDMDTSTPRVAGRIISIQSAIHDNLNAKAEYILNSFSPFTAIGAQLSNLAPLMNKRRLPRIYSQVTLQFNADLNGANIPDGTIVSSSIDRTKKFATTQQLIIAPNGFGVVLAEAIEASDYKPAAGTITVIESGVYGVASVTNPNDGTLGRARETDAQLRFRMLQTSSAASGTPEGIYTAISQVDGVTYASVLENFTDTTNSAGMPPHSIMPVVDGGDDAEVALAILETRAAGIDFTTSADIPGATWESVAVTNPANGQPVKVWFVRPTNTTAAIEINISTDANFPTDGQQLIKDEVVNFVNAWPIGKVLYASRLYTPVNLVAGVDINSVTINGTDRVSLTAYQRLNITDANITITVTP